MSDPFTDAYRPHNKPKGFGWWNKLKQKEYLKKIYARGDRDDWLIYELYSFGMISREQARIDLGLDQSDVSRQISFDEF